MSEPTVLSDAELDAVSGGLISGALIVLAAGSGGNGGTALVGGQVQATGDLVVLSNVNLSVKKSHAHANGGAGGSIVVLD